MSWQSVLDGLDVLLHWQTYAVVLVYVIISKIPGTVIGFTVDENIPGTLYSINNYVLCSRIF
jgi:hypothetical protein